jgi:hypothetical protein
MEVLRGQPKEMMMLMLSLGCEGTGTKQEVSSIY